MKLDMFYSLRTQTNAMIEALEALVAEWREASDEAYDEGEIMMSAALNDRADELEAVLSAHHPRGPAAGG